MRTSVVLSVVLALCFWFQSNDAFRPSSATKRVTDSSLMMKQSSMLSWKNLQQASALTALVTVITTSGLPGIDHQVSSVQDLFQPAMVKADYRASQKSTYFRFSPKFLKGREFYRTDLKNAIDQEKWDVVEKFFEQYASKVNRNDPNQVDAYDTYVNNNLYRPMRILAGSFAERGSSPKQRILLEKEMAFEQVMDELEGKY